MISHGFKMDEIDRNIVQLIQKEPHLTHTQIAQKVNRSQPTIGLRIRKLEETGVLKYQAGINVKAADLHFAKIELETKHPELVYDLVKRCPFMFNVFRLSGTNNMFILAGSFSLEHLDSLINHFFRNNPDIKNAYMEIIIDVLYDFVLPIDLNFDKCKCDFCGSCEKFL